MTEIPKGLRDDCYLGVLRTNESEVINCRSTFFITVMEHFQWFFATIIVDFVSMFEYKQNRL